MGFGLFLSTELQLHYRMEQIVALREKGKSEQTPPVDKAAGTDIHVGGTGGFFCSCRLASNVHCLPWFCQQFSQENPPC